MFYESREAVFYLSNDYSSIISEDKYKRIHGIGIPSMLGRIAKVSNCNFSDHSNLKILSPKQKRQRLLMPPGQIKAGNTSENLLNGIRQIERNY